MVIPQSFDSSDPIVHCNWPHLSAHSFQTNKQKTTIQNKSLANSDISLWSTMKNKNKKLHLSYGLVHLFSIIARLNGIDVFWSTTTIIKILLKSYQCCKVSSIFRICWKWADGADDCRLKLRIRLHSVQTRQRRKLANYSTTKIGLFIKKKSQKFPI